jgi:hypothetical protein
MLLPPIPSNVNAGMFSIAVRSHLLQKMEVLNRQVCYQGNPIGDKKGNIVSVDNASFKALSFGFFADKTRAYGLTHIIKSNSTTICLTPFHLDVNSFEVINLDYAKDKNYTYFADGAKSIKGTDYTVLTKTTPLGQLNTIEKQTQTEIWQSDFILNKGYVYYRGKLVKDALPDSFRKLNRYWYKDDKSVFLQDGLFLSEQPKIHAASFIALGSMDGTDKDDPIASILYNTPNESLVDKKPYQDFFEAHPELSGYWYFEAKKKKEAQKHLEPIALSDGFYQLGNEIFYKDIFFRKGIKDEKYTRIPNTTTANFKVLSQGYATNGISLFLIREEYWSYFMPFRNLKANIEKIEILSEAYVYDGTHFYYKAIKKFKADPNTFKPLNHIYAFDKDGLICEGVRKKDVAITENIKVLGGAYLKIEDTFYYMGKSRNKSKIDDSEVKLINDFIIMGADGSAFNHGKYRKFIGDFNNFKQLENGNFGDGTLEWKIAEWGLEAVQQGIF